MGLLDRLRRGLGRGDLSRADAPQTRVHWPSNRTYYPNWFQLGAIPPGSEQALAVAAVYSSVSHIATALAQIPFRHYEYARGTQGRIEHPDSPAARVLRRPNDYQTCSDWMLQVASSALVGGNGYSFADRDDAYRVSALHHRPPSAVTGVVTPGTGSVFYDVTPSDLTPGLSGRIPSRDVLHIRAFTSAANPLRGLSPIEAAYPAVSLEGMIQARQQEYFGNRKKIDAWLSKEAPLTKAQANRLSEQFDEIASGRTPVLDDGLTYHTNTLSAGDLSIIEQRKLNVAEIASVYRVPIWMVGGEMPNLNNAETLTRMFIATTLGFWIRHFENGLTRLFALPPGHRIVGDVEEALLRGDLESRIKALVTGTQGGLYTINEARAKEGLSAKEGGDEPFLQKQMQPISVRAADDGEEPGGSSAPAAAVPPAQLEDEPTEDDDSDAEIARMRMAHAAEVGSLKLELHRYKEAERIEMEATK